MANFKTHFTVAAAASGLLASGLLFANLANPAQFALFCLIGTLGGILPDIDSHRSVPAKWLFTGLGMILACLVVFNQLKQLTFIVLIPLWIVIYLGVRYGLLKLFAKFTVHRGNFHSLLAAMLFGLAITVLAHQVFKATNSMAWFSGSFMTVGYLIHLVLDELYSVDLVNKRLKKSWGSALKLASFRYKLSTLSFIAIMLVTLQFVPNITPFFKSLATHATDEKVKGKSSKSPTHYAK